MKDFKDIQEGILGNIDDTLRNADINNDKILKEKILNYFNIHKRKGKGYLMFYTYSNPVAADLRGDYANMLCHWDEKEPDVLVVDFNILKNPDELRLYIKYGSDLPQIKFIDHKKRKDIASTKSFQRMSLHIVGDEVDISRLIHPDTNVSSVCYGDTPNVENCNVTNNSFPGTIRNCAAYCCIFDSIDKKAWPKCQLKFHKDTRNDMFMNAIGLAGSDVETDMYSGYTVIEN